VVALMGLIAVVADVLVAVVGMFVGYLVRFRGSEVWPFLRLALPAVVLLVALQILVAHSLGLYRSERSRQALSLMAGAAAALLIGSVLVQFGFVVGLSRMALLCQCLLFVIGGLSWRRALAADAEPSADEPAASALLSMLPGAAVGALLAVFALNPGFVDGTGVFWDRPERDYNAYLVGWQYFIQDTWRFPILDVPAMGYPEGGSVLFNDALPLGAITSKIVKQITGVTVNPFGYWVFATYVLLGAFTSRLVRACGVRSTWAGAAAAFIVVTRGLFMFRFGHVALSGHFLIVWAFCLYVEDVRTERFSGLGHALLSAVAMLVNAYLVAMVALIQAATVLTLLARAQLPLRSLAKVAAVAGTVVMVGVIAGYGHVFGSGGPRLRTGGFGLYSWNPVTTVIPSYVWNVGAVVRDATGGQYEGDSYLGAGAILVIVAVLLMFPIRVGGVLRRHWVIVAAVLLALVFAGSHRLYFGSRLIYEVPLPQRLLDLASFFRASGRFVWLAAYSVPVVAVAALVAWAPRAVGATVLLAAVAVHSIEARPLAQVLRNLTSFRPAPLLDDSQIVRWMSDHSRVFMFPSYLCGTLTPDIKFGSDQDNRELHLQLLAARLNRPSNSIYTSRPLKDCALELEWATKPVLEDGVLYLVSRPPALAVPALLQLYASGRCMDGGYAVVCSTGTLRDDSSPSGRDRLHLEPMVAESCGAPSSPMSVSWTGQDDHLQVRVGSPSGEVVGEGHEGSRQLDLAPGTNLFLMRPDPKDPILDVETVYQRSGTCGAGDRNTPQ
jgi:hypothetical protein